MLRGFSAGHVWRKMSKTLATLAFLAAAAAAALRLSRRRPSLTPRQLHHRILGRGSAHPAAWTHCYRHRPSPAAVILPPPSATRHPIAGDERRAQGRAWPRLPPPPPPAGAHLRHTPGGGCRACLPRGVWRRQGRRHGVLRADPPPQLLERPRGRRPTPPGGPRGRAWRARGRPRTRPTRPLGGSGRAWRARGRPCTRPTRSLGGRSRG